MLRLFLCFFFLWGMLYSYTCSSIFACLMHLRVKTVRFASWMSWCPIFCHPNMTPDRLIDLSKKVVEAWALVGLFWELGASKNIVVEPMALHFDPHALGISWLSRYLSYSHCCLCMFVLCIRFPIKCSSGLVHITRRLWASVCDKMWTCVGWSCDRCATWIHLASSRLKIEG